MLQMRKLKHGKQGFAWGYVPDSPESSHVTPLSSQVSTVTILFFPPLAAVVDIAVSGA